MNRRKFIRNTALGAVGTFFLPEFLRGMELLGSNGNASIKKLIVIQLSGGNDGLNTVIPIENDVYFNLRPKLAVPKNEALKINELLGFNPSMTAFKKLYDEGLVSVVNSVGYPNPNRSHFRSMDIWQTGVASDVYSKTGWLGRYMDAKCLSSHAMLELDGHLSLSMRGQLRNGLAVEHSDTLYNALRGNYFKDVIAAAGNTELSEDNQGYLNKTLIQTNQSAQYISEKHTVRTNNFTFPNSQLGKSLGQVAQFIQSGFSTQVYYVSHNGFDSHVNQRRQQDALLEDYSESVYALVRSLEKAGEMKNTLILTFSEFGRRVKENGSAGTDHGKANNLFLISGALKKPGVFNDAPDLMNLDDGDVSYQIDFRNVYADVIADWFGENPNQVISPSFQTLGIL